jgi:cob(I)alamin adenosyltransferase
MSKLRISDDLSLPIDAVTQTFGVLAKRGVGKTYTASVMAEEMLAANQQVVVLDPTGAWFGLRSSADGRGPGFPILVAGGDQGDIPLRDGSGEVMARAIVERRFSAVLDLSLFRKGEQRRFVTPFLETLYRLNREAVHLFVDEADDICPQKPFGDEAQMVGAMEDVVKRGRRKGIGCTLITQRPADLAKQVLTQCEVLVSMRLTHPRDIAAIKEWVNVHADPGLAAEMIASLPALPVGTAWVWSPGWGDVFKRVQVRQRRTFDSSATPKAGEKQRVPKSRAEIDIDALGAEIAAAAQEAKASDPKALKAELAKVQAELAKLRATPAATLKSEPQRVEVAVLKDGQLARAEKLVESLETVVQRAREALEEIAGAVRKVVHPAPVPAAARVAPAAPARPVPVSARVTEPSPSNGSAGLGKCERAILSVLSQFPDGCEAGKLTLLSGYRYTGSFRNSLGALRTAGLIDGDNGGTMRITPAGMAHGPFPELPTGRALVDYWLTNPHFGLCERKILGVLVESPDGMTTDELCKVTGYGYTGSFRNSLGALRTAGVLVGRNSELMKASEELLDAATAR